jgi:acyl dehydratase
MIASSGSVGGVDLVDRPDDSDVVDGKSLFAHFTKRDLVLYALGIGCCGGDDEDDEHDDDDDDARDLELRFVYEGHRDFEAFPTFLLSLPFVATGCGRGPAFGMCPFPPQSMVHRLDDGSDCGLLPGRFYRDAKHARDAKDLPILHVSQSLTLHDGGMALFVGRDGDGDDSGGRGVDGGLVDPPVRMRLETSITSVTPRQIGTFVESETAYHHSGKCVANSRSVALILGLNPDAVVPLGATRDRACDAAGADGGGGGAIDDATSVTVVRYRVPENAALLYRLSGDYNPIHVGGGRLPGPANERRRPGGDGRGRSRPVLHGLCTLGYALRAVLRHVHRRGPRGNEPLRERNEGARLYSVRCDFVGFVFVNDVLCVEVWDDGEVKCPRDGGSAFDICFRVFREHRRRGDHGEAAIDIKDHRNLVVDKGRVQFRLTESVGAVSRL